VSARFETSTCRNCLGTGCLHCNHKGAFLKRLSPRLSEREAAVPEVPAFRLVWGQYRAGSGHS